MVKCLSIQFFYCKLKKKNIISNKTKVLVHKTTMACLYIQYSQIIYSCLCGKLGMRTFSLQHLQWKHIKFTKNFFQKNIWFSLSRNSSNSRINFLRGYFSSEGSFICLTIIISIITNIMICFNVTITITIKNRKEKKKDNDDVYVDSTYNEKNVYVEKQIHSLQTYMLLKFVNDRQSVMILDLYRHVAVLWRNTKFQARLTGHSLDA